MMECDPQATVVPIGLSIWPNTFKKRQPSLAVISSDTSLSTFSIVRVTFTHRRGTPVDWPFVQFQLHAASTDAVVILKNPDDGGGSPTDDDLTPDDLTAPTQGDLTIDLNNLGTPTQGTIPDIVVTP